jgi:transposase-like protein
LGPDRVADLVAEYAAGAAVTELAERYGVHRQTVRRHARLAGLDPPSPRLDGADAATAVDLYEQGLSIVAIGSMIGASTRQVRAALADADVPIRPRGWPKAREREVPAAGGRR